MVEHAAVNRVVVGSSPTFGANLTVETQQVSQNTEICRTDSAQNRGDSGNALSGKMKFPVKVTFRKAEAKIYGKSAAYPFYRLCYYAAGKRRIQSFSTYSAAKTAADEKVQEIAKGNQSIALTPKEATAALSIRDALDTFRRETGRSYTALEAVTGFLDVVKQLPEGYNPTETYSASPATSKSPRKTPRPAAASLKFARRWPHGSNRFGGRKAPSGTRRQR
jgi:hypothetical protein